MKLYKQTLHSHSTEEDASRYKAHQNLLNRVKRQVKTSYYIEKCKQYKTNTRKLWQVINQAIGKPCHKGSITPFITIDGVKMYNPKKIANSFGQFYSSLGSNLANKIIPGSTGIDQYIASIPRMVNSVVLLPTTQIEVAKIIKGLPNKTSSGHDQINNILLKKPSDTISYPLTIIFNQTISQGVFPDTMKLAEVIPLYKGRETDQTVYYHPISPLMTMSKVLEKIIYSSVYKFLDKNNILYESQYGFQNKRSCEEAISELLEHVLQAKEGGDISAAMFLDLSKAFDTLNHIVLLKKLDQYGIQGIANDWFKCYLHNRFLKTKVLTGENKLVYSDTFPISYGTAQGSCLGPLLFMTFCNDVNLLPLMGS